MGFWNPGGWGCNAGTFFTYGEDNPIPNGVTLVHILHTVELTLYTMFKKNVYFTTLFSRLIKPRKNILEMNVICLSKLPHNTGNIFVQVQNCFLYLNAIFLRDSPLETRE